MFLDLYRQHIKVFLADATPEVSDVRDELMSILLKAGMEVVDGHEPISVGGDDAMRDADCSVHILGTTDIYTPGSKGYGTAAGTQYRSAKLLCGSDFKMFVWNPSSTISAKNAYVNSIRRDIVENTVYIDKSSPIVFVEDIRNIMNVKQTANKQQEQTDIFFLYNELDSESASDIFNMLKDFQKVIRLGISMSSDVDYNTYIRQQLATSKIGVVYYNYAGDWAVSFARQVWKDTGGNSSRTPILVVGNNEHANEKELSIFKGIMECAVDEQLRIPLDIKVFLDKTISKTK